jgi:hypothetical protein
MKANLESISMGDVYPEFTAEQCDQAAATFRRYIAVMTRIYLRVRTEFGPEAATMLALGDLTDSDLSSTMPDERSIPANPNPQSK